MRPLRRESSRLLPISCREVLSRTSPNTMLALALSILAFQPAARPAVGATRSTSIRAVANPLDVVASPLRKFEVAVPAADAKAAAATNSNILTDLPLEVVALFAVIVLVGIAGLVKTNMGLSESAPTVGMGETRGELADAAREAQEELANMSQADKEKRYFKEIAGDLSKKRGGSKANRKKSKK